jgi:glucosamine-6-phosphate deaminase
VFYLDKAAGWKLTRFNTPWTIKGDIEDPIVPKNTYWILKSVTWLSKKVKKPILRLTYDDYEDHHLSQLVIDCAEGSVESLNLFVYRVISSKITGWPLSPRNNENNFSGSLALLRKESEIKHRVLIFSPHPDDDVISMGGTLKKLHDQGHEVHVAYMTSGCNGVNDLEARKYVYFMKDFTNEYCWDATKSEKSKEFLTEFNKSLEETDLIYDLKEEDRNTEINWAIKRIIRSSEAKVALNFLGIPARRAYCLKLPFYGTSHFNRKSPKEQDYEIVRSLLRLIEPTVIFAAGNF